MAISDAISLIIGVKKVVNRHAKYFYTISPKGKAMDFNRFYLRPEYVPPRLIGRDEELSLANNYLEHDYNVWLFGNTGSGKTTLIRHLLMKLEGTYIDASIRMPLMQRINDLKNWDAHSPLYVDNLHGIKHIRSASDFLYAVYHKSQSRVGVLVASTEPLEHFAFRMAPVHGDEVMSRFMFKGVTLRGYFFSELEEILADRLKVMGIAYDTKARAAIAHFVYSEAPHDVRLLLDTLSYALQEAKSDLKEENALYAIEEMKVRYWHKQLLSMKPVAALLAYSTAKSLPIEEAESETAVVSSQLMMDALQTACKTYGLKLAKYHFYNAINVLEKYNILIFLRQEFRKGRGSESFYEMHRPIHFIRAGDRIQWSNLQMGSLTGISEGGETE
jgi:Cdc6-like AAA superfamily ATPase